MPWPGGPWFPAGSLGSTPPTRGPWLCPEPRVGHRAWPAPFIPGREGYWFCPPRPGSGPHLEKEVGLGPLL